MDIATIVGIVLGIGSLVGGFVMDGGSVSSLIQPTAMVIVFGGTLGAVLIGLSLKDFIAIGKFLKVSFLSKPKDPMDIINLLFDLAQLSRKEGLLALEDKLDEIDNEFIRSNLQMMIDGSEHELLRGIMEIEIMNIEGRHKMQANIFDTAGGFAPTMGIIGTVMGLIHVLGNLSDVNSLGPKIATAFTATLYGVMSANIFWHPIANKLKNNSRGESLIYEIAMEGILSIQAGENPNTIRHKLTSFLPRVERTKHEAKKEGEKSGETQEA